MIFSVTNGSSAKTPGKFIISPSATILSCLSSLFISLEPIIAPDVSKSVVGTQDGAVKKKFKGTDVASFIIYLIPFKPMTLAISCGSVITEVVPCETTASANLEGVSMELSM